MANKYALDWYKKTQSRILECGVCTEIYNEDDRAPRLFILRIAVNHFRSHFPVEIRDDPALCYLYRNYQVLFYLPYD
jgi:hypothetical protein